MDTIIFYILSININCSMTSYQIIDIYSNNYIENQNVHFIINENYGCTKMKNKFEQKIDCNGKINEFLQV